MRDKIELFYSKPSHECVTRLVEVRYIINSLVRHSCDEMTKKEWTEIVLVMRSSLSQSKQCNWLYSWDRQSCPKPPTISNPSNRFYPRCHSKVTYLRHSTTCPGSTAKDDRLASQTVSGGACTPHARGRPR